MSAATLRGQRGVERAHIVTEREDQRDIGVEEGRCEASMETIRLGAKLEHVAEHGDAPPACTWLDRAEYRKCRAHRSRARIVAFVDQLDDAAWDIEPVTLA